MSTPLAKLSVLVCKDFACVKIAGRANFMSSPDFKTLLTELNQKGYRRFIIDLSECVLMDSTFLGVLAGFGMVMNPGSAPDKCDIELFNPSKRIRELLNQPGRNAIAASSNEKPSAPDALPVQAVPSIAYRGCVRNAAPVFTSPSKQRPPAPRRR